MYWILAILFSIGSVWATYNYAIEFSAFAFSLAATILSVALFRFVDIFFYPEIDTLAELKNGNKAVGMFYISLAIIIGAALIGSR